MNTLTEPKTNEQELRELDGYILEHVFGGALALTGETNPLPHYSSDPTAAMRVLQKCAAICTVTVEFGKNQIGEHQYMVARLSDGRMGFPTEDYCKCAPTLPLAICKFASQLFHQWNPQPKGQ